MVSIRQCLKVDLLSQKYESCQCFNTERYGAQLRLGFQEAELWPNLTPAFMCVCVSLLSETSELVYCVADLQMSNQKLQEEVRKLKQVVEGMEDSNQKLAEENEELHNQARV